MSEESLSPRFGMDLIEVGAAGDELPLFQVRDAVRQGERLLAEQLSHQVSMEARLSSILGWSAAALVAAGLYLASHRCTWSLAMALAALLTAVFCSVIALWPRSWAASGYGVNEIWSWKSGSEFHHLETYAMSLASVFARNDRRVRWSAFLLRAAWVALLVAATFGAEAALEPTFIS